MVVISSCDEIRAAKSTGGGDGGSIVLCYTLALRQKYRIHFHEKNSRRATAGWLLKNTFLLSMPFLEARNY